MEYLGGPGTLAEGTAGLTAEQIANAKALGVVGTNAASGMGYLGGASSLPAGTAGITGATAGASIPAALKNAASLLKGLKNTGTSPSSASSNALQLAQLVRGNENPFYTPKEISVAANPFATNQPVYIGTQLIK